MNEFKGELYIFHGRLDPSTGGTDLDGNEIDDWGFDGPRLQGVRGFHWTYQATFRVWFVDAGAAIAAKELTGWEQVDDDALEMQIVDDCVRVFNKERDRFEFFGDWGLI